MRHRIEISLTDQHVKIIISCPKCGDTIEKAAAWILKHDQERCERCKELVALSRYQKIALAASLFQETIH